MISKLIFWVENIYYITVMLLRELLLVPFIFLRIMVNILRAAKLFSAIGNIFVWVIIGPFFLLYCVLNDMYFFSKILCDYREDDDATAVKQEEDSTQDRVVIYNEVLDTLRAIMNTLKYQKLKKLRKYYKDKSPRNQTSPQENPLLVQANKFDMMDEL